MVQWIIHLKDGRTVTDQSSYPHDFDASKISSVERVVSGHVTTITGHEAFTNFFVKSNAVAEFRVGAKDAKPKRYDTAKILGCFVMTKDGPLRLELATTPDGTRTILKAYKVNKITKDGF